MEEPRIQQLPEHLIQLTSSVQGLDAEIINPSVLGKRAIVIRSLLTKQECLSLIQYVGQYDRDPEDNADGVLRSTAAPKTHRNDLRLDVDGKSIADAVFQRISPVLSSIGEDTINCTDDNAHDFLGNGLGMKGAWRLHSLNTRFRFGKYNPGGHFGPHTDGDHIIDPCSFRSLKTCMLYLNEDYVGGATNFADSTQELYKDESRGIFCLPSDSIHSFVQARMGDCIIFDHKLLHEGGQVLAGCKYIFRTDVMYQKDPTSSEGGHMEAETEQDRIRAEAVRIFYEGADLEMRGDINGAISMYKKAYRLCPEVEAALA